MTDSPALNRRKLFHAAIGASAAPLLIPLWSAEAQSKQPQRKRAPGQTLVVVFHGLFAFLFGAKGQNVSVAIPNVPGHVYWAGDFGHEDQNTISSGKTLKLSGVNPGGWNPIYDFPYVPLPVKDNSAIYANLTLPWPDDLIFDRNIPPQNGKDFFSQPSSLKPKRFPMIYSFAYYDSSITSRPVLGGTSWKAPRSWGKPGGATQAVLHVRAEHCGTSTTNGWDVFNTLFGLSGSDRIVLNDGDYGNSKPDPASGISGVVSPDEDDFLTEEPGCKRAGVDSVSRPVNCASIGGNIS